MNKNGDNMISDLQNMFKQEVDGNIWLRDDCEKEIEKRLKEVEKLKVKRAFYQLKLVSLKHAEKAFEEYFDDEPQNERTDSASVEKDIEN